MSMCNFKYRGRTRLIRDIVKRCLKKKAFASNSEIVMAVKQAKARQSIRYVMSGGHSAKHGFLLCPYFRVGIRFMQYLFSHTACLRAKFG